jgi:hypothetical protein
MARGFLKFAAHRNTGPMVLVRIAVSEPDAIIMRGHEAEDELVINPYDASGYPDETHFSVLEQFHAKGG